MTTSQYLQAFHSGYAYKLAKIQPNKILDILKQTPILAATSVLRTGWGSQRLA